MSHADRHVIIVGPGAVGTVLAIHLHRAGWGVTLAGRPGLPPGTRCASLLNGKHIESANLPLIPVDTGTPPRDAVVCVCVKAYATASVVMAGQSLLQKASIIVSAQNGAGNIEQLAAASRAPLVLAPPGFGAAREGDGIRLHGLGETPCAAIHPSDESLARFWAKALVDAQLPATVQSNWQTVLWRKIIANAAINTVTTLYNVENGQVSERDDLWECAMMIIEEAVQVATAEGIGLPPAPEMFAMVKAVCHNTATNRSSMREDALAGRPTEIEQITGAIVERANRHGIPCPVNTRMLAAIRGLS